MATMATESSGGPPLGSSNTPPATANPSRQPSVNKVNSTTNNDPFGGGSADNDNTNIASVAVPSARDVRANSLAEPSSQQQQQRVPQPTSTTPTPSTTATNNNNNETISYSAERIIGNGSFGVVFQASVVESGEIVAIKKVLQDKRFKNRELQIMRQLVKDGHSNIVALKHCFYSQVSV